MDEFFDLAQDHKNGMIESNMRNLVSGKQAIMPEYCPGFVLIEIRVGVPISQNSENIFPAPNQWRGF